MKSSFVISNVRIFGGEGEIFQGDVWIEGIKIKDVGAHLNIPLGINVIDGTGKTVLPGLIDAHTHIFSSTDLATALIFGVTTELDMANDPKLIALLKAEQEECHADARADIFSAGTLVTVPNGHGTENTVRVPTMTLPCEAAAFVDARLQEGSDYIKIICEDGSSFGFELPTLTNEAMRAVVEAAHKRNKLAVAHISSLQGACAATSMGVDGLVHLFQDALPDQQFTQLAAQHNIFVIPTLTVLECLAGVRSGATLLHDNRISPWLTTENQSCLEMTYISFPGQSKLKVRHAQQAVRDLKNASVPILAGTDASNPGTAHGASLHRELELLVQAGLTPSEALTAATSGPARVFQLADRGRIAPGLRADLLLVQGDPTIDITATRDIVRVWKAGAELDRRQTLTELQHIENRGPAGSETGLVSDFDSGAFQSNFGAGWAAVSDGFQGGTSWADLKVAEGGANQGKGCLLVQGEIGPGKRGGWAGAIFYPGRAPFNPANLSSKKKIRFWARAEFEGSCRLAVHHWNHGIHRHQQIFIASVNWQEYSFPFSAFQTDGRGIMGVLFLAGPVPGRFGFQIDDVRIE